jgi:hypothetical protein
MAKPRLYSCPRNICDRALGDRYREQAKAAQIA